MNMTRDGKYGIRQWAWMLLMLLLVGASPVRGQSGPANPITVENAKTGNPASQWDISGSGAASIQGFATQMSVNKGETVRFKVKTTATSYRLDIYRMGYYNGMGARLVATVTPSATLPQNQPNPLTNTATGLIDCGNWAESASWPVPASATSGIYIAKLVQTSNGAASHIIFVVRDDAGASDILFQTADTTWQAYNSYGGNSLYQGSPVGRAYKVSYNRPFNTRAGSTSYDWFFGSEYPMVRWLEANGYNVSYTTGVDSDKRGNLISTHRVFLSVGHDEYWSATQRTNVEAARGAGVHLAFFSGNEVFWKTRWENSIDGSGTSHRTLVCYKETHAGAKIDPNPAWTGTWRDPRFSPPSDGGYPENELTGTLFAVNGYPPSDSIKVPAEYGAHWIWKSTGVDTLPAGGVAVFPPGTLGYEWDVSPDNAVRPPGLMHLSSSTVNGVPVIQDYGSIYASGQATHNLALYRHPSGAFVFGAGTIHWSWGLDSVHDNSISGTSQAMRQATVNLLAKMQTQPGTLQSGLVAAASSTDAVAPASTIQTPAAGSSVAMGAPVVISGTASDTGGSVWTVEVSTDGGANWAPAAGRNAWSYSWTPSQSGSVTLRSRAFDDSGNQETPGAGTTVVVSGGQGGSVWPGSAVPGVVDAGPDSAVQLGVKFRSDTAGIIKGIRFYKAAANTGVHVGSLWSGSGTRLATATFSGESASGWQQVNFTTPVSIAANTVYVASYHTNVGHYSEDQNYFLNKGVDNPPLHLLANGVSGGNGVYAYGTSSAFPTLTYRAANYWVDVVFQAGSAPALNGIVVTPANAVIAVGSTQQFTATGNYSDGSNRDLSAQAVWASSNTVAATITTAGLATGRAAGNTTISATVTGISGSTAFSVQTQTLLITTSSLPNGRLNAAYSGTLAAGGGTAPYAWSLSSGNLPPGLGLNASSGAITGTPSAMGVFNFTAQVRDSSNPANSATKALSITIASTASIWPANAVPAQVDAGPDSPVELGVKFRSDIAGSIIGIRYYKASANSGTHVGNLWSNTGTRLATATFTGESASGWQQVTFATPVPIQANTVYVASYHTNTGHYSDDQNYFAAVGVDNAPLHALASGVSGPNGVYAYGASSVFPTQTWRATNYWVDVVFSP